MESSDAETGMVDCGVGTIVWVRRRNGSWWPGKILGPDELSASHLMSPRSGTPVKLLGREDASVDWYNLEKSKRVKPFRCGEFDDCIERAAASQGMPPKKREKYARREDAILHALELEKQLLERKYSKLGVPSNGMSTKLLGSVGKGTTAPPELSFDNVKCENSKMDLSLEDKKKGLSLLGIDDRADNGSQLGIDDKSSDVRPRMRGLQDIGLGPVPLKCKVSSLDASNGSHKYAPDDSIHDHLDDLKAENTIPVNSNSLLERRKRSHEGHLEESLGKRRDRRRPLVQVLESSVKLPLVNSLQLPNDGGSVPLLLPGTEQREVVDPAKGSDDAGMSVKSDDSFGYNGTFPDQVEISTSKFERRNHTFPVGLSEANTTGSTEDTETDSSGTESLISDTYDAIAALSDEGEDIELIPKSFGRSKGQGEHESMSDESDESLSVTVSKWQLKGKRNSRSLMKRKVCVGSTSQWTSFKREDTYGGDSLQSHDMMNWEDGGYWEYHGKSMLIDVEVQVQSGYQREHVPMISLMSKLNDKAIVGHPIPIETLEDGSSETILSAAAAAAPHDQFEAESLGYDVTLQPWRTARRSANCRVPRPPHLTSTLDEEEHEYAAAAADEERKVSHKGSTSRKCLKKPQRRSSLSCSQKTRTLASIGGSQQQQGEKEKEEGEGEEGLGVMKATVACIPVKLVFSRLHEELVARHQ